MNFWIKWISSTVRLALLFVSDLISFNLYEVHEECISSYNSERNSRVFRQVHYISIINVPISTVHNCIVNASLALNLNENILHSPSPF